MKRSILRIVMVGLLMVSTGAYATFIYDVNRTIGVGSLVGTITTDMTLGPLAEANITDWSLTLNLNLALHDPVLISGPGGADDSRLVFVNGPLINATSTTLTFVFEDAFTGIVFCGQPCSHNNYEWYLIGADTGEALNHPHLGPMHKREVFHDEELVGEIILASRDDSSDPVPVPEPGTLALFGIGLFGMGLARRRRKV